VWPAAPLAPSWSAALEPEAAAAPVAPAPLPAVPAAAPNENMSSGKEDEAPELDEAPVPAARRAPCFSRAAGKAAYACCLSTSVTGLARPITRCHPVSSLSLSLSLEWEAEAYLASSVCKVSEQCAMTYWRYSGVRHTGAPMRSSRCNAGASKIPGMERESRLRVASETERQTGRSCAIEAPRARGYLRAAGGPGSGCPRGRATPATCTQPVSPRRSAAP